MLIQTYCYLSIEISTTIPPDNNTRGITLQLCTSMIILNPIKQEDHANTDACDNSTFC